MKPRLLDLFCGAGGAAMGYFRSGFEVLGVHIEPKTHYPFEFVQADALEYLASAAGYSAIHASPPCQAYSAMTRGTNAGRTDHAALLRLTRQRLIQTGLPFVIENVVGAPMRRDLLLCGTMFGLDVFRHRVFEFGGWRIGNQPIHQRHRGRVKDWRHGEAVSGPYFGVYGRRAGRRGVIEEWQAAMDIDWMSARRELTNAIPPAYTQWIGSRLGLVASGRPAGPNAA